MGQLRKPALIEAAISDNRSRHFAEVFAAEGSFTGTMTLLVVVIDVPEPGTLALIFAGSLALTRFRRARGAYSGKGSLITARYVQS